MTENDRREYLIRFLRGCAGAADDGQLGIDQARLLLNGKLMAEAADEFEKLLPKEETFKDTDEELKFHLVRAENHARAAHDLLFKPEGPKRSMWFRMLAGRAQSILIGLYVQE